MKKDKSSVVNFVIPAFFDMNGNNMFFGGAERYLLELVRLIRRMGYDTNIYQCANSQWVRYYHDVRVVGLEARNSDELNQFFHFNFSNGFLTIYFAFFLASPYFHQPSIGISHGIYWDEDIFQHFPYGRKAQKDILSSISHLSTLVSVDTNTINWLRAIHLELAAHSVYIPNFVDLKQFQPILKPDRKDGSRIVVLYPRRLNQARGFWLAHRLVSKILEKYDNVDFHFVGKGDIREEQAIKRLVKSFPSRLKWYFLPPEKMHEAYQQADITIIPTIQSEGTSLSCLEALASGNTVIATNVGGLPNLILPNYNGLLIEPNIESFYEALTLLIENQPLRLQLAKKGREVAEAFDIKIWRSRWQKVLQKYLPTRDAVIEEPMTAVFYPRPSIEWNSFLDYYLRILAKQLAERDIDVYWVQAIKGESGNERVHLVTKTDDLYLSSPLVFFDGHAPLDFFDKFENSLMVCDASEGVTESMPEIYHSQIHHFISYHENSNFRDKHVKYIPNVMELIKLIKS